MKNEFSIYIHYPFCKAKCPYCDFNSHVREKIEHDQFLCAYEKELDFFASKIGPRKVKTIFFGGGTPSLMPISLVEGILQKISKLWEVDKNCEITLEANPTSFESAKFQDLKNVGINRLSIGIQALNDEDLKFLGREHSAKEAIQTIEIAQKIFDNFSFDLIYARPKQSLKEWENELKQAIDFGTKHLSLYQLTIEKGTKFYSKFQRGEFEMPSEELAAEMYDKTNEILSQKNFRHYEISNYAKEGFESKHNLVYWQGGDYIGIGAGAHSRVYFEGQKNRQAIMMNHEPNSWLKKVQDNRAGIQKIEDVKPDELLEELILMGLRLEDGIDEKTFQNHFNRNLEAVFDLQKLQKLVAKNLIFLSKDSIKIPQESRILTNAIIAKICDSIII